MAVPGANGAKTYDLVVIGAGTAAMVGATRVRATGKSVAVVDCRPYDGTCALRGCDPKKMLISGASAVDHVRRPCQIKPPWYAEEAVGWLVS